MKPNIIIRKLESEETPKALNLVWNVFMEFEAPNYTKEGIEEFDKSIHDENYLSKLCFYGAFDKEQLIGVLATRSAGTHIALFFVDGKYHRQGIGTKLFKTALKNCSGNKITVNASVCAAEIYHKLGFYDTDEQQTVNGLKFTPMEFKL
ncbi:MAG: GNAT family N-acetyltransferase [Acutalibacteraceae bacterium]